MNKLILLLLSSALVLTGCQLKNYQTTNQVVCTKEAKICPDSSAVGRLGSNCEFAPCPNSEANNKETLMEPIADFQNRITKKPFGILITPQTSPVQPEKFTGYHNGVDVEYQDIETEVPVFAIADGQVIYTGNVNGYGGVVAIKHHINGQNYVAIYGHLNPNSLVKNNTNVIAGQKIGILGIGYSSETDGERKHLHFSLKLGDDLDLTGYVKNKSDLDKWINPEKLIK